GRCDRARGARRSGRACVCHRRHTSGRQRTHAQAVRARRSRIYRRCHGRRGSFRISRSARRPTLAPWLTVSLNLPTEILPRLGASGSAPGGRRYVAAATGSREGMSEMENDFRRADGNAARAITDPRRAAAPQPLSALARMIAAEPVPPAISAVVLAGLVRLYEFCALFGLGLLIHRSY